jgi:hypothetical protein
MNATILIAGLAVFLLTIGAGVYAQEYGKAEMVHFRVAVPAGTITEPTQVKTGGQPVEMAPLAINLARRGFLKNLLNPGIEGISTHGIVNAGKKPLRIRMQMVNATVPVRWEVKANHAYDPASQTFTDPLMPGKSVENLAIDWYFELPPDTIYDPVIYDGGLKFTDADTGEDLTFLPIRIVNGDFSPDTAAGACH